MPLVTWTEEYDIGVEKFNDAHKKLFDLINQLHDAMKEGKGKEVIGEIVGELEKYTTEHFSDEEKEFDERGYPDSAPHKEQHKLFVSKIAGFKNDIVVGNANLSMDIIQFLKDWLINHIKGVDMKYKQFFNEHGLN